MPLRSLFAVILILGIVTPAIGQEFGRAGNIMMSGMSYRSFVYPGEASIQLLVFSNTGGSGIYEIGTSITLEQLLALSGAVGEEATGRQRSRTTVRLYRENAGTRILVYESRLSDMLAVPQTHPDLREGDMLEINRRTRQRFTWRDAMSLTTSTLSLIWAFERVRRIF